MTNHPSSLPAWMTTDRTIVLTNAPDAYDYGYVDQLGPRPRC